MTWASEMVLYRIRQKITRFLRKAVKKFWTRRHNPPGTWTCPGDRQVDTLLLKRDFSNQRGLTCLLSLYWRRKVIWYKEKNILSQHFKNWLSIEDGRRCVPCKNMHGKIYEINEIPNPEPPLHERCRCIISPMKAMRAGTATNNRKLGADSWLNRFRCLPPY